MNEERLANIERTMAETNVMVRGLIDKVDDRIEADDNRHDRLARTVYGNNGSPGVLIKLDRLEQAHLRQTWVVKIIVGVIITGITGGVWALLTG